VGGAVTFRDVAGAEEAREELGEVVDYLRNPDRYASVGAVPPKGVLLFGPPGCGKTLLAKAVAGEAGVPFFSVAGAEFVESLVGVGAARVRDLFAQVRANAPAIVFIDELDAAARRRGAGSGGGSEERDQTLNQMLVEMDGFDVSEGIVVMAATNRPDILDPALLRPGRFDRHVLIDLPDIERREDILRLHATGRPIDPEVDFHELAHQTPGFTGADLANVINEAALLTIRAGQPTIDEPTLSEAVQRVLAGPQRRGHLLTDDERRRVACHEAGHAIAAALLGQGDRVHRVSIVARGRGLGTIGLEREDRESIRTTTQLRAKLAVTLAGRAAEELAFGEASTGAEDDLESATRLARDMAGRHGLSEEVGAVSVIAATNGHLGPTDDSFNGSEAQWSAFDSAVRRLVDEGREAARTLLEQGEQAHSELTELLLKHEALEGARLQAVLPPALEAPRV
jgi:cell division protease FtsH